MRVSVCIPTRNRPGLAADAVRSCLDQTVRPSEILIGDDSDNDRTGEVVRGFGKCGTDLIYRRNTPPLGQARNVDSLFGRATGDKIILLHDDDLLCAPAIEHMASCFEAYPEVIGVFGKQSVIDEAGRENRRATGSLNRRYFRTPDREGVIRDPLRASLLQQFPNDGFMVDAAPCKQIGYDDDGRAGGACDFYFGFRLASLGRPFFFLNEYTARYRLTRASIMRSGKDAMAYHAVRILLEDITDGSLLKDKDVHRAMVMRMKPAILEAAAIGDRTTGLKWYFSRYHRSQILTPGGIRRLLKLILPLKAGP